MTEWIIEELADFDEDKGLIHIGDERLLVVPASFLPSIKENYIDFIKQFDEITDKAAEVIGKRKFFLEAYKSGRETAEKIPEQESKKETLLKALEILEQIGYGRFEVLRYEPPKNIVVRVDYSPEAEWSLEKHGEIRSDKPVCDFLRGFASGAAHSILGAPIQAEELMCIAKGEEFCKVRFFVGDKPGDSWLMDQDIF